MVYDSWQNKQLCPFLKILDRHLCLPRLPILWYQGCSSRGVKLIARPHPVRKLKMFPATTTPFQIPSWQAQDQTDVSPSLIVAELKNSASLLPKSAIVRSPYASKSSPCSPPALGSF